MVDTDRLLPYGWTDTVAKDFLPFLTGTTIPGRVLRVDRGACDVITPDGPLRAVNPAEPLCTGDWVTIDAEARVSQVIPRHSAIVRATASARSESQLLAANVDTVLVTAPLDRPMSLPRVERLLALAWESGAQPVVVLTKSDAAADVSGVVDDVRAVAPGVTVLAVSAATGNGMDVLTAVLHGTVAVLGPSGAGKSTLANALLGRDALATDDVRAVDHKGRHTTVTRELIPMPPGGTLIDTPGLRGVGLWDASDGLDKVFVEIDELAVDCRFADCAHDGEPGCAVRAAIDSGDLPQRRLDSYRKLVRENEWMVARTDALRRAERTRAAKAQSKAIRAIYRERRR